MDKLLILPPTTWPGLPGGGPSTTTPSGDPRRSQLTVAGKDAVVPILYGGPERLGGMIYHVAVGAANHPAQEWRGSLSVVFLFCEGPVDTINALDVQVNDKPYYHDDFRNGIAVTVFDGSQVTVPGWLPTFDPTWTETMNGYCGLHMRVLPGFLEGFPRVTALVKGKRIFDPRTSTTVWSDNPALIVRDIAATYEGRSVDETAAGDAADACDELVGDPPSEKRSRLTLLVNEKRLTAEWRKIAAEYIPGWVQDHGAFLRIVADAPGGAVEHTFNHSNIAQDPPPRLTKLAGFDVPDVVEVGYTDTSDVPWTTRWAVAGTGNAKTRIERPGIRSYAQALRLAYTTLNHLTLENVEGEIAVFDYGLTVMPGDLAQVTLSAFGWTNKQVRVTRATDRGNGWWTVAFRIYDPAAYNEDVVATPTWPGTDLPKATLPPTVTSLALTFDNGDTGRPYIIAHWDAVNWPFFESYYVQVWDETETNLLLAATVYTPRFVSSPLNGGTYVVRVYVRSTQATIGEPASDSVVIVEWQEYGTGHVRYDKVIIDDDDNWHDMVDPGSGNQPTWNVHSSGARLLYRRPFKDWYFRVEPTPTGAAISVASISEFEFAHLGGIWSGGDVVASGQVYANVANGTAPLVVNSTTLVANLNADLLDGQHGSYYTNASNLASGTVPVARLGTGTPSSGTFLRGDGTWSATLAATLTVNGLVTGTVAVNAGGHVSLSGGGQIVSTTATGTAPLNVQSTTLVANLNADTVDGYHAASFALLAGATFTGTIRAPKVETYDAAAFVDVYDAGGGLLRSRWQHDTGDSIEYRRSFNDWVFYIGGAGVATMGSAELAHTGSMWAGGNVVATLQVYANVPNGTAPLVVTSSTKVANLNADMVDDTHLITASASLRANRNITGGGTITVDGSGYVIWSSRFIVIANGRGSHFATAGHFDISCPTSGTITGVGGASNKTATAAGIPLGSWEALYYILPIGSGNASLPANFRVASYTSDLEVPHSWVLICVRNGDNGRFYFNNGAILGLSQSFDTTAYSTRRAYDSDLLDGYHAASFALLAGATFTGAVSVPSLTTGTVAVNAGAHVSLSGGGQLVNSTSTGTAPLFVISTTKVTNLNADLLDGYSTSATVAASTIPVRDGSGNLEAGNRVMAKGSGASFEWDDRVSGNAKMWGWYATGGVTYLWSQEAGTNIMSIGTNGVAITVSGVNSSLAIVNTSTNGANIKLAGNGGATPDKWIRAESGYLQFLNSAYNAVILQVDDAGRVYITGGEIYNTAQYARMEWGSTTVAGTPYMDFHSSGNAIDYDVRILATGGNGTAGNGALYISAGGGVYTWGTVSPGADNTYPCGGGGNRWTAVYAVNGAIQTSDSAQKRDVVDDPLGLDFVLAARPVAYRWRHGDDRLHHGFIGQELWALAKHLGIDLGAVVDEGQGVNYAGLIAPLYRAMQQQHATIQALRGQVAALSAGTLH